MGLFDIKKLKESVGKSAEGLKKSLADAAEKLPESAKGIEIPETMKDMAGKGQSVMDSLKAMGNEFAVSRKEKAYETKAAINAALTDQRRSEALFSARESLQIMYCLMLIDGTVSDEEMEKYNEIGMACDQDFDIYKQELIAECNTAAQSESAQGVEFVSLGSGEDDDYYDQIHDFVGDLIKEENFYRTEGVQARGLIWNLLAIAYSEGEYSASEKRLIRYITKKCGVDYAILLEMEHTFNTLLAIEKEEEWLKSSDRPYKAIEERVKELKNRKNAIMQGVNALIMD